MRVAQAPTHSRPDRPSTRATAPPAECDHARARLLQLQDGDCRAQHQVHAAVPLGYGVVEGGKVSGQVRFAEAKVQVPGLLSVREGEPAGVDVGPGRGAGVCGRVRRVLSTEFGEVGGGHKDSVVVPSGAGSSHYRTDCHHPVLPVLLPEVLNLRGIRRHGTTCVYCKEHGEYPQKDWGISLMCCKLRAC